MKNLNIEDFKCSHCRMPYSPEHRCLCQTRGGIDEMHTPGSNQRAITILFALLLMAITATGLLWALRIA